MLEKLMMRTFLMLYGSGVERDKDDPYAPYAPGKSASAETRAFSLLSSVCWDWHQALAGWEQSPTRYWVKRQLRKRIERK